MSNVLNDFKKFIMRGNVLDLAVAVIIGAAFKLVVDSFVNDIIMKVIGAIFGQPSFDTLSIRLRDASGGKPATDLTYGAFLTTVVNFLIVAAALFVVIKSFEALQARRKAGEEPEAEPEPISPEGELLQEIRDILRGQAGGETAGPGGTSPTTP